MSQTMPDGGSYGRVERDALLVENERLNRYAHELEEGWRQSSFQVDNLSAENERLRLLLRRISEWDHFDSAGDGPYWRAEIAKALDGQKASSCDQAARETHG